MVNIIPLKYNFTVVILQTLHEYISQGAATIRPLLIDVRIVILIPMLWKVLFTYFFSNKIRIHLFKHRENMKASGCLQLIHTLPSTHCNHQAKQQKLLRMRISQPPLQLRRPQPVRWKPRLRSPQQLKWRPLRLRSSQPLTQTSTTGRPWLWRTTENWDSTASYYPATYTR